jgi:hypothetical protein
MITAAVMIFVNSAAWALFDVTAVTMHQRQGPAELLGRVTSVYGAVSRGAQALGGISGGLLAAVAGIRAPMLADALPIAAAMMLLPGGTGPIATPRSPCH